MSAVAPLRVPLSPRFTLIVESAHKHGRRGVHLSIEVVNTAGRAVARVPGGVTIGLERIGAAIDAMRAVAIAVKAERETLGIGRDW